ncbi:MAG: SUMF1/EgtB/PvdO family nonheme iron enzyme [Bryobacteraceae bacterium]
MRNGVVTIEFPKGRHRGNGVVIGPRMVITCAHVVKEARKGTKIWIDGETAATIRGADARADLALLDTDNEAGAPLPWREAGSIGEKVTYIGSSHPDGRIVPASEVCPASKTLTLAANFPEGASGGGVFRDHGAQIYCIGVLDEHQHMTTSSTAIGIGKVRDFCRSLGVELPDKPAAPPPPRKYDIEPYWEWLRGHTQQIDFRGLKAGTKKVQAYPMDDLFIPLMTYSGGEMRKAVPLEEALRRNRMLVIQGDAGSGKTTFLRYEAWQYCRPEPGRRGIPLLVSIARLDTFIQAHAGKGDYPTEADSPAWISHYLMAQSTERKWGLERAFFETRLTDAETVVLLDGLDEATSEQRREQMARLFEQARTTYKRCRWVVTTRPAAYEGKGTLDGFTVTAILDLEQPQIEGFLKRWSLCLKDNHESAAEEHCRDLRGALDRSPWEIRKMARNPLMLSALAVVHYNESRLPDQRAELYECILKWLARSREEKPGRPRDAELLDRYGYLAVSMQDAKGKYLTRLPRAEAAQLLARQYKLTSAAEMLAEDEIDSGIITSEGTKEIKFYHRSFQEYLAARYLAELEAADRKAEVERLIARPEWRETLVLLAGCLHGRSEKWLNGFFRDLVAYGLGRKKLEGRARVVGLVGSMLTDLAAVEYALEGETESQYGELRTDVMRIFEPDGAPELGVKTRAAVADALAQGGDPRLKLPRDPGYWVKVGKLWFGRFPVTVHEYARYVESGGKKPGEWLEQMQTPSRPVVRVSWHDANGYCNWVGAVRLPTDAEWAAAAYGSKGGREFPWGDRPEPNDEVANFGGNVARPSSVGLFPEGATPEGLMDMAGNVWEWTSTEHSGGKSVRGGSFGDSAYWLRAAYRYWNVPGLRYVILGFRLVRESVP